MSDRRVHLAATTCLTALSAITVISLCRVFPDWDFLVPMLAVAVGTHVMAAALRFARAPLWVALPLLVLALFVLISVVFYRDTMAGPLPTGRTLDLMGVDLRLVVQQFPTAVAPVPSQGSFAVAIAALLGLCAILSDTFAFRAFGRVEAVVPTAVLFVFAAALGTDRWRVGMAALWISAAILTIAMLRFSHIRDDVTWMGARRFTLAAAVPAMLVTAMLGAAVAAAVAPRLPGAGEPALLNTRNHPDDRTEILSPLVDIRGRLRRSGNAEMFTVKSSNGPHYWRAITLPEFNGDKWQPSDEQMRPVVDDGADPSAELVRQVITVKAMRGNLVPAAATPVAIDNTDVLWAPSSESLVLHGTKFQAGDTFDVASMVSRFDADMLRSATTSSPPSDIFFALPDGLPSTAHDTAVQVTKDAPTDFDRLLVLQDWFRTTFDYDQNYQLGNSNDAIAAFLRDRRGFCQQFAGTFAVMARTLGMPARVAVGYTPGDLGADGLFHVFGRHAHAWPEVWFDGVGWVAFEPTPGRGSPDGAGYTGHPAEQNDSRGTDTAGRGPTNSTPNTQPRPTTTVPRRPGGGVATTTTTVHSGAHTGSLGSSAIPVLLLSLLIAGVLWILLAPRAVAALARRRTHSARERVVTAWYRACHALTLAGAQPIGGATPAQYAQLAHRATGVDGAMLDELAQRVTVAVYAPSEVTEADATRCETIERDIDALCRPRTPWSTRWRELVDPRWMMRRFTG